jgi:hypothetical protein
VVAVLGVRLVIEHEPSPADATLPPDRHGAKARRDLAQQGALDRQQEARPELVVCGRHVGQSVQATIAVVD